MDSLKDDVLLVVGGEHICSAEGNFHAAITNNWNGEKWFGHFLKDGSFF